MLYACKVALVHGIAHIEMEIKVFEVRRPGGAGSGAA